MTIPQCFRPRTLKPYLVATGLMAVGLGFLMGLADGPARPPNRLADQAGAGAGPSFVTLDPAWDVHRLEALESQLVAIRARLATLEGGSHGP